MPVRLDLPPAWKRTSYSEDIVFIGPNWSDVDLKMEVRNLPGDTGDPLISLERTTTGGQGLSTDFVSRYPIPNSDAFAQATILNVRINETTLEALLLSTPTSAPLQLAYDVHVGNNTAKRVVMHGLLVINPGVTL